MLRVLRNSSYRLLLGAQVVALLGTGLATVGLALLAYELAGAEAGAILGTALFIKMLAYVGIAPLAGAIAARFPRKAVLIGLDGARAGIALALPFVDQIWQVYVLIFLLQAASAIFTPTFQATIPDIVTDEDDYTRALSLSRLAYELENLLSPALATLLLFFIGFHWLFAGTAIGFVLSALMVLTAAIPAIAYAKDQKSFVARATDGIRIYLATPRLRGMLALNLSVAAAGAMVIVNSVVIVRSQLQGSQSDLGIAMSAFGAGSMLAAIALPRMLDHARDRTVMISGGLVLAGLLAVFAIPLVLLDGSGLWPWMLATWLLLGTAYSAILTPGGRLLRRSAHAEDRPSVFAAQFALSHACWLVTYPLAGWLGASAGMPATITVLAALTLAGVVAAWLVWPSESGEAVTHEHPDLPADHPHLRHGARAGHTHAHAYVIDDLHPHWPRGGS